MKTLKQLYEESGFGMAEFAVLCGISSSSLSDYCNMKQYPRTATQEKIAKSLGMSVADIDFGSQELAVKNRRDGNSSFRKANRNDLLLANTRERILFAANSRNLMFQQKLNYENACKRSGLSETAIRSCFDPTINIGIKTASVLAQTLGSNYGELTTKDLFDAFPEIKNECQPEKITKDKVFEDATGFDDDFVSSRNERKTYRTYIENKKIDLETKDATGISNDGELYLSYDKIIDALDKIANKKRREIVDIMAGDTKFAADTLEHKREILDIYQFEIPAMICQLAKER